MRSLFLKIFLSFWAAQALFLVLAILVVIALRPTREPGIESMVARVATESVAAYKDGGEPAARSYVEDLENTQHVHAFIFDPSGKEISGRMVFPWIEDMRRTGRVRHRSWLDSFMPERFYRQSQSIDGQNYTLVLEFPAGPRVFGPHGIPSLGLTIAVISSGLVCYLLAWSLTSPVVRLRQAAQRLAAGDLTARTGAPMKGRRDELAQLMRDFDRMAERIEALMDSQSRLLKDVSHELRSPLARLSVALGLARRQAAPGAEAALNRIELEADRLNQLIQRLLTISRLETGTDGILKTRVSLRDLVEHVVRDAEYEAQGRGCSVFAEPTDEYPVDANPDLLRSAIENVVRNAIRYTAAGTAVEVRLERRIGDEGEDLAIRVLDSGPGVPEEALDKIFEPFYRIDDARNRQTGGAGLGLSIADRAVRLHGGRVRASNRPEGGLAVEIRIPAAPAFALPAHS
ncbi:MAG: two-component sensor histidine kinase [Acidobacteria bacterium]|nr:MAG: two-component sensor histidine kinase [Acidobacteriota bacterium]